MPDTNFEVCFNSWLRIQALRDDFFKQLNQKKTGPGLFRALSSCSNSNDACCYIFSSTKTQRENLSTNVIPEFKYLPSHLGLGIFRLTNVQYCFTCLLKIIMASDTLTKEVGMYKITIKLQSFFISSDSNLQTTVLATVETCLEVAQNDFLNGEISCIIIKQDL